MQVAAVVLRLRSRGRALCRRLTGGEPEEGQGMVEYALILTFVAIAVLVALQFFGQHLTSTYTNISNGIARAS
ncbi:MAG TPA: Flp family type IVb pilin [Candidatus Micrarchaeia archaeon]|nr:Flp family type IVb pilin [Candidatus Micrarchaeia archaeon]